MAYQLQALLNIRSMREDRALQALGVARRVREESEATVQERRRDYSAYLETREQRRDEIYATVIGRVVTMDNIEVMQEGVARIDAEGALLKDNILRAEAVVEEKKKDESSAEQAHNFALKNKMKIESHRDFWAEEERHEHDRKEELELEEFAGRKQEI